MTDLGDGGRPAPRQVGRYEIGRLIGRGGFGQVYKAYDPNMDRDVAIKILTEASAASPELCMRFIREARLMRALENPGVVTVYDVDETADRIPYLVMELCGGGTLGERLKSIGRALTTDEAKGLIELLATSTGTLHHPRPNHPDGIVHRDLKPSNYLIRRTTTPSDLAVPPLLTEHEQLVVADFGLAKPVDIEASRITIAGGTRTWSPPEQFTGSPEVTTAADVYALSAIVVYALSDEMASAGEAPPVGEQLAVALRRAGPMAPVLERGMSPNPKDRPVNALEWREALLGASQGIRTARLHHHAAEFDDDNNIGSMDRKAQPKRERSLRRSALTIALIAVALAAAVAVVAATVLRGPDISGPTVASAGDRIAYVTRDSELVSWSVNGQELASGRSIVLEPQDPGTASITATQDLRSTSFELEVRAPQTNLRIVGPALVRLGETTNYSVDGADSDQLVWSINGQETIGPAASFRATDTGTIHIAVDDLDGGRAARTITVDS